MTTVEIPTAEILERGYRALLRELGPAGFIQFVQHFDKGSGDYTDDRHRWLTQSVDEIFNLLESKPGGAKPIGNAEADNGSSEFMK